MARHFKDPKLRMTYERAVEHGKTWDRNSGNGSRFWKGYDMARKGLTFQVYQRGSLAYVWWCAGQDVAKAEGA